MEEFRKDVTFNPLVTYANPECEASQPVGITSNNFKVTESPTTNKMPTAQIAGQSPFNQVPLSAHQVTQVEKEVIVNYLKQKDYLSIEQVLLAKKVNLNGLKTLTSTEDFLLWVLENNKSNIFNMLFLDKERLPEAKITLQKTKLSLEAKKQICNLAISNATGKNLENFLLIAITLILKEKKLCLKAHITQETDNPTIIAIIKDLMANDFSLQSTITNNITNNDTRIIEFFSKYNLLKYQEINLALKTSFQCNNREIIATIIKIFCEYNLLELPSMLGHCLSNAYKREDREIISLIFCYYEDKIEDLLSATSRNIIRNENYELLEIFLIENKDKFSFIMIKDIINFAIEYNSLSAVKLILKQFPAVDYTFLIKNIIKSTNMQFIDLLFDPEVNCNIQTLMASIVENNKAEVLRYILTNYPSKIEVNDPKIFAIATEEFIEILKQYGGNINTQTENGETALSFACKLSELNRVKMLIKNGAIITAPAIVRASEEKHFNILDYLIEQYNPEDYTADAVMKIITKRKIYTNHLKESQRLIRDNLITTLSSSADIALQIESQQKLMDRVLDNLWKSPQFNLAKNLKIELEKGNMEPLAKLGEAIINRLDGFTVIHKDIGTGEQLGCSRYYEDLMLYLFVSITKSQDKKSTKRFSFVQQQLLSKSENDFDCFSKFIIEINYYLIPQAIEKQYPNTYNQQSSTYINKLSIVDGYISIKKNNGRNEVYYNIPTSAFDGNNIYLGRIFDQETLKELMTPAAYIQPTGGLAGVADPCTMPINQTMLEKIDNPNTRETYNIANYIDVNFTATDSLYPVSLGEQLLFSK